MIHVWRPEKCVPLLLCSLPPPLLEDSQLMFAELIMDECISQPLPSASIHLSSSKSIYSYSGVYERDSMGVSFCSSACVCLGAWAQVGAGVQQSVIMEGAQGGMWTDDFIFDKQSLFLHRDEQHPVHPLGRGGTLTGSLTLSPLRPRHRRLRVFWLRMATRPSPNI